MTRDEILLTMALLAGAIASLPTNSEAYTRACDEYSAQEHLLETLDNGESGA